MTQTTFWYSVRLNPLKDCMWLYVYEVKLTPHRSRLLPTVTKHYSRTNVMTGILINLWFVCPRMSLLFAIVIRLLQICCGNLLLLQRADERKPVQRTSFWILSLTRSKLLHYILRLCWYMYVLCRTFHVTEIFDNLIIHLLVTMPVNGLQHVKLSKQLK